MTIRRFSKSDYDVLAHFRYELRRFLRFGENAARQHGITPQQHQLLLAIKGYPGREWATLSELADRLQLRHHSVVGIVDRTVRAGLVTRTADVRDRRMVDVRLTPTGEQVLAELTAVHRQELQRMSSTFKALMTVLDEDPSRQ